MELGTARYTIGFPGRPPLEISGQFFDFTFDVVFDVVVKRIAGLADFLDLAQIHVEHDAVFSKRRTAGVERSAKMEPDLNLRFFVFGKPNPFVHPADELPKRFFVRVGRLGKRLINLGTEMVNVNM